MGSCLSKKSSLSPPVALAVPVDGPSLAPPTGHPNKAVSARNSEGKVKVEQLQRDRDAGAGKESFTKREVFVIKHRKSHDRESRQTSPEQKSASTAAAEKGFDEVAYTVSCPVIEDDKLRGSAAEATTIAASIRTSNCTKEEVDAILIQCGRLSRSSSGNVGSRSYSGSKRSYDFDNQDGVDEGVAASVARGRQFSESNEDDPARRRLDRRQSRPSPTREHGRRRTPSRERDQQRSSSTGRERRVSRSPGRRPDSNASASLSNAPVNASGSKPPGKMVSVPATMSVMDKTKSNLDSKATAVRRISVKRNQSAGDTLRAPPSPRSQSPARQKTSTAKVVDNDVQQPQPTLSRSSSRKTEKSPYRRNPLSEIDPNSLPHPQPVALLANHKDQLHTNKENKAHQLKLDVDKCKSEFAKGTRAPEECEASAQNTKEKEQDEIVQTSTTADDATLAEIHQTLARIKSSRGFGIQEDPQGSYTSLLLQDIQNFHQNHAAPSFSLPPCVAKACSIYDAVADLNSGRRCNDDGSTALDNKGSLLPARRINSGTNFIGAKSGAKDPFVESELAVDDDLTEPSILKYVTVKRGGMLRRDDDERESSGSNSFVFGSGGAVQQLAWEPSLADDSPNCGTSMSTGTQRSVISDKAALRKLNTETGELTGGCRT